MNSKHLENAQGELEYSMIDNAYKGIVSALFGFAPYA